MTHDALIFHDVAFTHDGARGPLFENLSAHFPCGWTGVVGANGAGKTTLLQLAAGVLHPGAGHIQGPPDAMYCPQRTDYPPEFLNDFMHALDKNACRLQGILGIADEWLDRWDTLSHGERKRAQIAVALWREPLVLAVDEPTNHLDVEAKALLAEALHTYAGVGLVVSHDRELLDALCAQCLFLEPPAIVMRPGGYTLGGHAAAQEKTHRAREHEKGKKELKKLERETARRREQAARSDRRLSKRGVARKDTDARAKKRLARFTGKDGVDGRRVRQMQARTARAQTALNRHAVVKDYRSDIWLTTTPARRDVLFRLPAGSIALGNERRLEYPPLIMQPQDRIAMTGPNGAGKSTLIARIIRTVNLPADRVIYMPQEIALSESRAILERARRLPRDTLGRMMTVVSCLGSRPQQLLESDAPSPGEIRKVLLATGIAQEPHLIVMDEPTNHLDLPSIENLEAALSECPCGLVLVSHDHRFLERLTDIRWRLDGGAENSSRFVVNID